MIKFLNNIRSAENLISTNRKTINTIALLFLGIALGTLSKYKIQPEGVSSRSHASIC